MEERSPLDGCSDGYCKIAGPAKGMHTNAGCRCLRYPEDQERFRAALNALRADRDEKARLLDKANKDAERFRAGWEQVPGLHYERDLYKKQLDDALLQVGEARDIIAALLKHEDEGVYLCDDHEACKCATHAARRFVASTHPQGLDKRIGPSPTERECCVEAYARGYGVGERHGASRKPVCHAIFTTAIGEVLHCDRAPGHDIGHGATVDGHRYEWA